MPEQLSFLDDEETPPEAPKAKPARVPKVNGQEPYSLYFSIFPGAQDAARIAEQCAALRSHHGLAGKPLLPHRLHITLLDWVITPMCRKI